MFGNVDGGMPCLQFVQRTALGQGANLYVEPMRGLRRWAIRCVETSGRLKRRSNSRREPCFHSAAWSKRV